MASTHKGTVYQMIKTNKTGSKVDSAHKGTEVTTSTPHRGHGYLLSSSHRSAAVSLNPSSQQKFEAAFHTTPHSASDYSRFASPHSGHVHSTAPLHRGTETRSRTEAHRHHSPHRKNQQVQTPASHTTSVHRHLSPVREETIRRGGESKPGREVGHRILSPDTKSTRRLSFIDQKDNLHSQNLQDDPPSKVHNPQGVRVPRRISAYPKDEAIQTDPIRKLTVGEVRSPKSPSSPEHGSSHVAEHRTVHRRLLSQEPEVGPHSSIPSESKSSHRNMKMASSLKLSVLKDLVAGTRAAARSDPETLYKTVYTETKPSPKVIVSERESNMRSPTRDSEVSRKATISPQRQSTYRMTSRAVSEGPPKSLVFVTPEPIYKQQIQRPPETIYVSPGPALRYPEPSRKPSIHAEVELTPRPLPPRSLPRYGPDSSWWALLNPEVEMPQSRPTTPDFEPKSPPPLDSLVSLFEMDSSPFCEDLMFQREKASSPSPPPPPKESPGRVPLREVPQAPKHTIKQPIQRFNAFFLDVSEEMQNRIIWWLKGLCFSFLWVHCGRLRGRVGSFYLYYRTRSYSKVPAGVLT
ncbi:hypothetical protein SUZIE_203040 [Sciurus carolinensis]|uniref:Uncharacterized protein n=1 Tax=Sciurus carolinensis TaxID=30640 RepID=A0AA41TAE8_SCICA|nr:hypothetical protein [Sciurus carolinensis]